MFLPGPYHVAVSSERHSNALEPHHSKSAAREPFQLGTDRAAGLNSISLVLPFVWATSDLTDCTSSSLPFPFIEQMLN